MAAKQDDLVDKLSKLSIKTESSNGIKSAWLATYPNNRGYSFRCSISFRQLIERQLSKKYFEELLTITEQNNKIYDFHMRVHPYMQHHLTIDITHKDTNIHSGPVTGDVCISCDMNNELSQLSLVK